MNVSEYSWKTRDGLKIFGCLWKPESEIKGAISLVHGLGEHSGRYQHVANALTNAGYAVVGFDLRGHGKSEGKRGHSPSYECLMDDIDQNLSLTAEYFPKVPVFLYGHSLGGNLVIYHTLTRKADLKGVIATSPGLATAEPLPALTLLLAKIMYSLAPAFQTKNGLDLSGLSHDQSVIDRYVQDPLVHPLISARLALDMFSAGKYSLDHASELSKPMLLLQGTADRLVNPKTTAEFAAKANPAMITYKEFPGLYHELHNEPQNAEIFEIMINWLNSELG